jgi:hypothetical protein
MTESRNFWKRIGATAAILASLLIYLIAGASGRLAGKGLANAIISNHRTPGLSRSLDARIGVEAEVNADLPKNIDEVTRMDSPTLIGDRRILFIIIQSRNPEPARSPRN